LAPMISPCAT